MLVHASNPVLPAFNGERMQQANNNRHKFAEMTASKTCFLELLKHSSHMNIYLYFSTKILKTSRFNVQCNGAHVHSSLVENLGFLVNLTFSP